MGTRTGQPRKAEDICYLVIYGKSLPTPGILLGMWFLVFNEYWIAQY